jgi:hypothetical protein
VLEDETLTFEILEEIRPAVEPSGVLSGHGG